MRTRSELEIEARRLEQRMREVRQELSSNSGTPIPAASIGPTPLLTLPESSVAVAADSESVSRLIHRMVRHIAIAEGRTGFEYRLIEEEFVSDAKGEIVRHYDPIEIRRGGDAFEIVSAGFQRLDEDQLWERIEPVVARVEVDGYTSSESAEAASEVELAVGSDLDLSVAARMRVKADAIDLVEGRLEMGDFVARTVARQNCFEVVQREVLSRQLKESIEV